MTHITCVTQEDINGADDAYLVAGGNTIWGPVQMTKGDSKDIAGVYHYTDDGADYWITVS